MADEGVINLGSKEIDPAEEAAYREKIKQARAGRPLSQLKSSEPVGSVPRPQMPLLQRQPTEKVSAPPEGVTPRPPGSPVLRPGTREQLAQAQQAAQLPQEKKLDEEKLAQDAKLADLLNEFDFGNQQLQVQRILDNKKRKEEIEGRCQPMALEDLIMKDEVGQRVPIVPGKFEPLFRSLVPIETLYLKQRMSKETITTEQYLGELYGLLLLTCSLVDINGVALPDHRRFTQNGFEVDDKAFKEKLERIMSKSAYVIADLMVNYGWFDIRVRRLLNPDDVKNG